MKRNLIKFLIPLSLLFACLGFAACNSPEQLSTPANLRIENEVLTWDAVEYADGYSIFINDEGYQTEECFYDLSELKKTEIYSIEVRAYTNKGLLSFYAETTFVGKYALPTPGVTFVSRKDKEGEYQTWNLGVDSEGLCVIPATYQGKPVTYFSSNMGEACTQIKTLYLPSTIQDEVFENGGRFACLPKLETIVLGEGFTRFVNDGNCIIDTEDNTLVVGCVNSVIPDYVTKIAPSAFYGRNLESIVIPDSVVEIGDFAFDSCKLLESIVIPDSVVEIGNSAFGGCKLLKSAVLPKQITETVMKETFSGCSSLTSVNIPEGVTRLYKTFLGCTSLTKVDIPESVQSLSGTFVGCTALKTFTVPSHIKTINGTFANCKSLKSVTVEEGVEKTGDVAMGMMVSDALSTFQNCTSLTEVNLPSTLTRIYYNDFKGCTALETVMIPEGVTTILDSAFADCISLNSISIPASVATIGNRTFRNCTSLQSIVLPDNLTKIEPRLFDGCTALESVVIPEGVTTIGPFTFIDCTSLKTIQIPESVTVISKCAFQHCSLNSIIMPKTFKILAQSFYESTVEAVYYSGTETEWEENLVESNSNTSNNETFLSAIRYYYSEIAPEEEGNYWHFVDGVPTVWTFESK